MRPTVGNRAFILPATPPLNDRSETHLHADAVGLLDEARAVTAVAGFCGIMDFQHELLVCETQQQIRNEPSRPFRRRPRFEYPLPVSAENQSRIQADLDFAAIVGRF